MMKTRGTYYVPTLMAAEGLKERLTDGYLPPVVAVKARQAIAALDATVRKAIARGIKVVVGPMPPSIPTVETQRNFTTGQPRNEAHRRAQGRYFAGCRIAGRGGPYRIAGNGEIADIVACPGNPEDNIRQVEQIGFVMKEGVVYRPQGE